MEQGTMLLEQLQEKYRLELLLGQLQQRQEDRKADLLQAVYEKREREQAQIEYEGSLKSFVHALSGKREDMREQLARNSSAAAEQHAALKRELERLELDIARTKEELENLKDCEEQLRRTADEPVRKQAAALEAAFCGQRTLTMLQENGSALEEALKWARPEVRIGREHEGKLFAALSRAGALAAQIRIWTARMNGCLRELEMAEVIPGPYFSSPQAFIVAVAADYAQLDRMNEALKQISDAQKQLRKILTLLT